MKHSKEFLYVAIVYFLLPADVLLSQSYPDQFFVWRIDSIIAAIETSSGVAVNDSSTALMLEDGVLSGYVIFNAAYAPYPFNQGLPSWNGTAPDNNSSFMVQMRFPYAGGWSPWLTIGFWKEYIWGSYGSTSYGGGKIDIDYVTLYSYQNGWQFRVLFLRNSVSHPSATLHKLSFFASDTRTTGSLDYNAIVNDNPEAIFIPTDFLWQYSIDPQIGGSICSPTSVSMILRSYGIDVDPLRFAIDTYDPYWGIFGGWPRVVQNASEYGLDGAVTQYRSWSQAYEVLAGGGRIAMSVGPPLYSGHLMMLAGFTSDGRPIVHDPAKYNGYGYVFNKTQLSYSWFDKGGIAYTFSPADSLDTAVDDAPEGIPHPATLELHQNYPNPFNATTRIPFSLHETAHISISLYDTGGRLVGIPYEGVMQAGHHTVAWSAPDNLSSGVYYIAVCTGAYRSTIKALLLK